jgi:chaperonin GroEL (HSP60 family)
VADALEKVGVEGVVSVEESKITETVVEVMEGMRFDRGYVSPYFVTNTEKMQVEHEDACLLLCDHKIGILKDLIPLLEQVAKSGQPLVLIADDIEGEALTALIVNHIRGVLKTVAIKAPALATGVRICCRTGGIVGCQGDLQRPGNQPRAGRTVAVGGGPIGWWFQRTALR